MVAGYRVLTGLFLVVQWDYPVGFAFEAGCSGTKGYSYDRYNNRCCKDEYLPSSMIEYDENEETEKCANETVSGNPNDDLATLMWKLQACNLKHWMKVSETDLTFDAFVNYQTSEYPTPTENNLQQLIRDANKACPDADNEKEFHEKVFAYYNCFYTNEEKTCNATTPEGLKAESEYLPPPEPPVRTPCSRIPGVREPEQRCFCCDGKRTPKAWGHGHDFLTQIPSLDKGIDGVDLDDAGKCQDYIVEQYLSRNAKSARSNNKTEVEAIRKRRQINNLLFDCSSACYMNPVLFKNDSNSRNPINFGFNKLLDSVFASLTTNLGNELKEVVTRNKNVFLAPVTPEHLMNSTGITLDEIEKIYPTLKDEKSEVLHYCNYYRILYELMNNAIEGYCYSDEVLTAFMKRNFDIQIKN